MNILIPIVAAALTALLVLAFLRNFDFILGHSASARLERFVSQDRRGMADRLGDSLVSRLGLSLDAWTLELEWARLGGLYQDRTVGGILGRCVLHASLGIACLLAANTLSPAYVFGVAAIAYYPYLQLRGRARDVRDELKRGLPEAAALIAAEMAAGASAETAVLRAASLPGAIGNLLGNVTRGAQQSGRLIFSRGLLDGALVGECARYRMPQLEAFARQIDLVASRGAEGPRQMGEVARGLAREYRSDVARSAEQLGNKLLFPISLYIFIPFMLAIFVPLMAGIFEAF